MQKRRLGALLVGAAWLLAAGTATAHDTRVLYTVTDVSESSGQPHLWEYRYELEHFEYGKSYTLTVLFPWQSMGEIETPLPEVGTDWTNSIPGAESPYALQPDSALRSDGSYNAELQVATAELPAEFSVRFTWPGAGQPPSQNFEVYDPDFIVVDEGTTEYVPEPALALGQAGVLALLGWLRRRRRRRP